MAANVYGFYIKQPFIFAIKLPTNKNETRNAKAYCYKLDQIRFYRSLEAVAVRPAFFVNLALLVVLGDVMTVVTPSRLIVRFLGIISPAIMIYRLGNASLPPISAQDIAEHKILLHADPRVEVDDLSFSLM